MITKLKTILVMAIVVASLPLLSTANKGGEKVTLCHNGHTITISQSAVQKHLDNHQKNFECFVVTDTRPCGSQSSDPKSPKPPKGPKGNCPDGNSGCQ